MPIARSRPRHPGPWARWASILCTHAGFVAAELVLAGSAAALVAIVKAHPEPLPGDIRLTLAWQRLVRPHPVMQAVIETDSTINWPLPAGITAAAAVGLFARRRRWLDVGVVTGTLVAATGSNFLTNQWVRRPRPDGHGIVVHGQHPAYFSFPSGHVDHALAVLGIITYLTFQVRRSTPRLWATRVALLAQIVLISPSRVLEGEHWPSDGLAGLLYGAFWLLAGVHAYTWAARRWPHLIPPNERREATGAA
jgi:membrane-associated phospholipid phosphatase